MPDLGYYIARARDLEPGSVLKRALTKTVTLVRVNLEGVAARLFPWSISDEELVRSLDGYASLEDVLRAVRGERHRFFVQPSARDQLVSLIRKKLPHLESRTVEEADKVCSHVFDLLGSGNVNLGGFVDKHGGKEVCGYLPWHFDFKTGYRWNPKKYYKEIRPAYGKADIKVPWELSRFQHTATLGQAYWLTGNERYAEEFVRQVDDWINRNPPKFGVNWACTMDVAIRVANWILGFHFLKDSQAFTDEFLVRFLKSLLTHGRHIMANLENKGITTNHYLADLVGLIYLGIAFPEFREAREWREFGVRELVKEMDKQVYDDGMDFEASTCYHRLALELFFYPAVLCRLNGIELPPPFQEKLRKMFDFVLYVLKPNGQMPQIGDNDNGRLHVLGTRAILDMTYLLTFAILYFDDPSYKIEEFGFAPEALWLFGPEAYDRWSRFPGRSVEELGSRAFPDGGIYVMRHKKDYMVISCGHNNQVGHDSHAHEDALSWELCVGSIDIIVDPGTYAYTYAPGCRAMFRSRYFHNAVSIDPLTGSEQSVSDDSLFQAPKGTRATCLRWDIREETTIFVGELHERTASGCPVVIQREIVHQKVPRRWTIVDTIEASGEHEVHWHLCLAAPATKIRVESAHLRWRTTNGWRSVSYGHLSPCVRLTAMRRIRDRCVIQTVISVP